MALFEGHCERFWLSGPTLRSGPSKEEQTHLIDPRSPDFFHLIPSTQNLVKTGKPSLLSVLRFLDFNLSSCSLFSPFFVFSWKSSLPLTWHKLMPSDSPYQGTCAFGQVSLRNYLCVVISVGGFLLSSGVSTSLEQILQA